MTTKAIEALWHDGPFLALLGRQARRHFSNLEDIKDAIGYAWERVVCLDTRTPRAAVEREAVKAIRNFHDRNLYRHKKDINLLHTSESMKAWLGE